MFLLNLLVIVFFFKFYVSRFSYRNFYIQRLWSYDLMARYKYAYYYIIIIIIIIILTAFLYLLYFYNTCFRF